MSIQSAINDIPLETGVRYLQKYFSSAPNQTFSGAHFESLECESNLKNRITAGDLLAVSTLGTPIGGKACVGILGADAQSISTLLSQITSKNLSSLSPEEFEAQLGPQSPSIQLWRLLRRHRPGDKKWGIGATRASKIMARKRPHLIPITDSVIDRVVGHEDTYEDWRLWWEALRDNDELEQRAAQMRLDIGRQHLSTLRIYDVMLWYSGKYGIHSK